ncbi:MAG TPA: hypothetical protein VJJ20_01035 [Candidatus Paceibacterota bacterium]
MQLNFVIRLERRRKPSWKPIPRLYETKATTLEEHKAGEGDYYKDEFVHHFSQTFPDNSPHTVAEMEFLQALNKFADAVKLGRPLLYRLMEKAFFEGMKYARKNKE